MRDRRAQSHRLGLAGITIIGLLLAAGCGTTSQVALKQDYQGPVPAERAPGTPIRLTVVAFDNAGKPYSADALPLAQYRTLAESAMRRAGFTLDPSAPTQATISLRGRTRTGLVNSQSPLGRNLAMGVLTGGIACDKMAHEVDAAVTVVVARGGQEKTTRELAMQASEESCFNKGNPQWLANHQRTAVRLWERAAQDNLGQVLPIVLAALGV